MFMRVKCDNQIIRKSVCAENVWCVIALLKTMNPQDENWPCKLRHSTGNVR